MGIHKKVNAYKPQVIAYRRSIHQHPELGFREYETTKLISSVLNQNGIDYRPNGDKTGVIATIKGDLPGDITVALRADIDALPLAEKTGLPFASKIDGVSHACGHDIHTAVLLGVARLLNEFKGSLKGTVRLLFQPAEELLSGARSMISNGALKNPEPGYVVAAHSWPDMPAGYIGIRRGSMFASADHFQLVVSGKSGHAAHPHRCIDPIVIGAHIITQLQTIISRRIEPIDSAVLSIGQLSAGTASNIIPDQAVMEGTIRALTTNCRELIRTEMTAIAKATSSAMGGSAKVIFGMGVPPMICDDYVNDCIMEAASELLGEDKVLTVNQPSMGAEDMALYLKNIPGAMFRIGTYDNNPSSRGALHNPQTTFSEQGIPAAMLTMFGTVYKLTGSDLSMAVSDGNIPQPR